MHLGKNLVSIKNRLEAKKMLRYIVYNAEWFVIMYMLLASALLSIPFGVPGDGFLGHFLAFIPYGFLFGLMSPDFLLLLGFPLYGEFIQLFFPWKYFDLFDMSMNILGSFLGFFIAMKIKRRILFS